MKAGKLLVRFVLLTLVIVALAGFVPAQQDLPGVPVLEVGGIALAAIIVAVVEVAKQLGLDTKYAPWLSGALSLVGYGLMILVDVFPATENYVVYVLNAVLVFLSATGAYHVAGKPLVRGRGKST